MSSQYYKVTAYVGTPHRNAVEVTLPLVGPAGPAGPAGTGLETLTTQGDTLYRGASTGERLPIGTSGQILRVVGGFPAWANESGAVTSVNGETGAVVLDYEDLGAAQTFHSAAHEPGEEDELFADAALVTTDEEVYNGVYFWDGQELVGGRPVFYKIGSRKNTKIEWSNSIPTWHLIRSGVVRAEADLPVGGRPWDSGGVTSYTWTPEPTESVTTVSVVRAPLETLAQYTAERASGVSTWTELANKPATFTPSEHTHGNLTNAGAIGTTANLPLRTGSGGVVEAGSFGTSAGSFCEGNDARLSDDRDPNLHAASHAASGSDPVFDQDLNTTDGPTFLNLTVTGTIDAFGAALSNFSFNNVVGIKESGQEFTGTLQVENDSLTANRTYDLPDASGTLALQGAITTSGLTQATARILGRTSSSTGAVEEITIGSGLSLSAGELSATGSGVTAVNSTLADILSVSGSDLVADDLAADKLYGWDDSESKAIGFVIGSGLSVSGDTLSATASGGSKTYAVFTATDNQPTATAFATLDTRNSIAVLDFDDATDESAVFVSIIPEAASLGSGLKIRLHWMATTATSGNVVWDVSLERMTTDLDSDSFDTIASGTAAANGTSGILTVTEITLTTIDSVTAGDGFRLKVTRDANNASDTMTGDAELVVCEVRSAA